MELSIDFQFKYALCMFKLLHFQLVSFRSSYEIGCRSSVSLYLDSSVNKPANVENLPFPRHSK